MSSSIWRAQCGPNAYREMEMKIKIKLLKLVGLLGTAGVLAFGQSTAQQRQFTTAVAAQPCAQDVKTPTLDKLAAKSVVSEIRLRIFTPVT
jgi:hypothetical protein